MLRSPYVLECKDAREKENDIDLMHSFFVHIFALGRTNTNTRQSDKIVELTNAAGTPVEPIWAQLLAKALEGKDVKDMLTNVGAGSGPAVAAPAAAAGGDAAAPAEEKKEEKKEEKEESDEDVRTARTLGETLTHATDGLWSLRLNATLRSCFYWLGNLPVPWCYNRAQPWPASQAHWVVRI